MKIDKKLTEKIMKKVSVNERKRLRWLLLLLIFVEVALFVILLTLTHKTVLNLIEKDFFTMIKEFDYEVDKIVPQISRMHRELWEEITEGVLGIAIIIAVLLIFVHKKGKKIDFSRRFKEIEKYIK